MDNKLGWAGPHSRFTLGFTLGFHMNFPNDIWVMRCSTFNIFRFSSIGICFHVKHFFLSWVGILNIWGWFDQLLRRYSNFNALRLPFSFQANFQLWFGPQNLSLKFEEDSLSGCWDIPILLFSGHFLLDVFFISCTFYFGLFHLV